MKECTKMSFETKNDAEGYLWKKKLSGNGYTVKFNVTRSYECPRCGKYHLTSKDKVK